MKIDSILNILQKGETSKSELEIILSKFKIPKSIVIVQSELPSVIDRFENIIMNLGSYENGGSHWVALNTKKKLYHDSFSQPPPEIVPSDYKYKKNTEIQGYDKQFCGSFTLLWLYYVNFKTERQFYNVFVDLY